MGTSRNTGSDKQTYYKLTTSGIENDSVRAMARTLFSGGAVDGDVALAEAAGSLKSFFHLCDIGVPFPKNRYGEYVGYKTDHDSACRGSSAGPLTSRFMTDRLLDEVREKKIPIFENYQVIQLLTAPCQDGNGDDTSERCVGVFVLDQDACRDGKANYAVFSVKNVVYATGGEAGLYKASVYPKQQIGGMGVLLRAGATAKNLTESQYGIASIKFRWNLSGTFQQVLPRYISTDKEGKNPKEFLLDYFSSSKAMLNAIFLKGYQWPFDPRKLRHDGSSLIDVLVYHETVVLGRRVYLDYLHNPKGAEREGTFQLEELPTEAKEYLKRSGASQLKPIQRLEHMNPAAVNLYLSHGIDLKSQLLEIAVCAQHCNGGIAGDCWWQSSIPGLFVVGEINGSHGIYRPGGSALNAGQVGGMRAAEYITYRSGGKTFDAEELVRWCGKDMQDAIFYGQEALKKGGTIDVLAEWEEIQDRMSRTGAHIRQKKMVDQGLQEANIQLQRLECCPSVKNEQQLPMLYRVRDLAVSQVAYLSAIQNYISVGGQSRGSYLILDDTGERVASTLPDIFRACMAPDQLEGQIQETIYCRGACRHMWRPVRPLPDADTWFENVWRDYRERVIFQET